jgi:hypothetical protein
VGAEEFFLPIGAVVKHPRSGLDTPKLEWDIYYLADRWGWTENEIKRLSYRRRSFLIDQKLDVEQRERDAAKNGKGGDSDGG